MENNNILSLEEAIRRSMPTRLLASALREKFWRQTPLYEGRPEGTQFEDLFEEAIRGGQARMIMDKYEAQVERNAKEQWNKLVREKVEKNPGYFGLPWLINVGNKFDEDETPLQGGRLRVDLDEYLETYKSLLENPGKINDYLALLDNDISEVLLNFQMSQNKLIKNLFGIQGNNPEIIFKADKADFPAINDYVIREVIEPYFDVDEESKNKVLSGDLSRVGASLKGISHLMTPEGKLTLNVEHNYTGLAGSILDLASESQMPSDNKERNLYAFEGLQTVFNKLNECPEIKGLEFDFGLDACIVPTYIKK